MKLCPKCKIEKPKSEFNKNKSRKDGLHHRCKVCANEDNKACKNTIKGKEGRERRTRRYRSTPEGKKVRRKHEKKYRDSPKGKEVKEKSHKKYLSTPKGKKSQRKSQLKHRYGITLDDYNTMLESQGKVCAICGTDKPGGSFHVDHDHQTSKIRGLLCHNCNTKLEWYINNKFNILKYLDQ